MQILRLIFAALVVLALGRSASCTEKPNDEKPNIVLFVSADHGLDALGCYGNDIIQTPNMDKLAAQGQRFNRAYCTSASCAASRSVILTGKFSHATGSYGHVHDYHHVSAFDNVKIVARFVASRWLPNRESRKISLAPDSVFRFTDVLDADPRSTVEMANACQSIVDGDKPFFLYFCPNDPHRGHPFTPTPWNAPNNFGNRAEGYPGVKPGQVLTGSSHR